MLLIYHISWHHPYPFSFFISLSLCFVFFFSLLFRRLPSSHTSSPFNIPTSIASTNPCTPFRTPYDISSQAQILSTTNRFTKLFLSQWPLHTLYTTNKPSTLPVPPIAPPHSSATNRPSTPIPSHTTAQKVLHNYRSFQQCLRPREQFTSNCETLKMTQ